MCGIVGVWDKKGQAPKTALTVLRAQTTMGREGAGIAWVEGDNLRLKKVAASPDKLEVEGGGRIAIGHNRLPSIGAVKLANTHPFIPCRAPIAVAHNGHSSDVLIVKELLSGHKFEGETDSEVLAHLIEELVLRKKKAMEKVLPLLPGNLVVLYDKKVWVKGNSGTVVAATSDYILATNYERALTSVLPKNEEVTVVEGGLLVRWDERGRMEVLEGKSKKRKLEDTSILSWDRWTYRNTNLLEIGLDKEEEKKEEDLWKEDYAWRRRWTW
jgi:glucosamine 6-phosphate synthetase-like amidotransferase/phosphosugar isomerase protein